MGLYEAPQDEQHRALALLTTFGEELPRSSLPALRCVSSAVDAHDRLASFQVA
jgi:hypothetical protein